MVISAKREPQLEQHLVDGSIVSEKNKKTKKTRNFIQASSRSSARALIRDTITEIKNQHKPSQTLEKTLSVQSRWRTNKLNQHMTPDLGIKVGAHCFGGRRVLSPLRHPCTPPHPPPPVLIPCDFGVCCVCRCTCSSLEGGAMAFVWVPWPLVIQTENWSATS